MPARTGLISIPTYLQLLARRFVISSVNDPVPVPYSTTACAWDRSSHSTILFAKPIELGATAPTRFGVFTYSHRNLPYPWNHASRLCVDLPAPDVPTPISPPGWDSDDISPSLAATAQPLPSRAPHKIRPADRSVIDGVTRLPEMGRERQLIDRPSAPAACTRCTARTSEPLPSATSGSGSCSRSGHGGIRSRSCRGHGGRPPLPLSPPDGKDRALVRHKTRSATPMRKEP